MSLTEEQQKKFNDARAGLTQATDNLKLIETEFANLQTELLEERNKSRVDVTPDADGKLTVEQANQMVADALAEREANDPTKYSQADIEAIVASKDAVIAGLEKQIEDLKAATPANQDQEAAQEELADKMMALVQQLRDLTPSKKPAPVDEAPVQEEQPQA